MTSLCSRVVVVRQKRPMSGAHKWVFGRTREVIYETKQDSAFSKKIQ
jgi:hypothetical protein